jgi:hypothetical protein
MQSFGRPPDVSSRIRMPQRFLLSISCMNEFYHSNEERYRLKRRHRSQQRRGLICQRQSIQALYTGGSLAFDRKHLHLKFLTEW